MPDRDALARIPETRLVAPRDRPVPANCSYCLSCEQTLWPSRALTRVVDYRVCIGFHALSFRPRPR